MSDNIRPRRLYPKSHDLFAGHDDSITHRYIVAKRRVGLEHLYVSGVKYGSM